MRLSDQDREARRRATAAMTKCACGNVARFGTAQCARCTDETSAAIREAQARKDLLNEIDALNAGAQDFSPDLRNVLRAILARIDAEG